MLRFIVIFLIVATIAGVTGFYGIAASAPYVIKMLFYIFNVLFIISLMVGFAGKEPKVYSRFGENMSES